MKFNNDVEFDHWQKTPKYKYRKTFRKQIGNKIYQLCKNCHHWKSINDFYDDNYKILVDNKVIVKNGKTCVCKDCRKAYYKYWYQQNKGYKMDYIQHQKNVKNGIEDDFVPKKEKFNTFFNIERRKFKELVKEKIKKIENANKKKNKKRKEDIRQVWLEDINNEGEKND